MSEPMEDGFLKELPDEEIDRLLNNIFASSIEDLEDKGPDEYDEGQETTRRKLMELVAFYAEEGPSVDKEGKYLCGDCKFMVAGETKCWIVDGDDISATTGSCQFFLAGKPTETNPLPMLHYYTKEQAQYSERPEVKGFGCFPRCEYGKMAKGQDSAGREIWCGQFGVHVRAKACCAFEDGKDLVMPE